MDHVSKVATTPKDGTSILIFEAQDGTAGAVRISRWRDDTIPTGWTGSERAPSHWLPLPLPPDKPMPAANKLVATELAAELGV